MGGNRGEVTEMYPNGMPPGMHPYQGPDVREIRPSAVLGNASARKAKGEYRLPFMMRESDRPDARLYVETMPQLCCRVTGFYVGGDVHALGEPEDIVVGQHIRLEIPDGSAARVREQGLENVPCGVFASVVSASSWPGEPSVQSPRWKLPVGARISKERVADKLTIGPGRTVVVQWLPELASRFKRFEVEIIGDQHKLFVNDFRIGKDSLFIAAAPVPLSVLTVPGALEIPDMIVPGIVVTVSLSNHGSEDVILGGGVVFENVHEELLALQKKYEEEQAARVAHMKAASQDPNALGGEGK